MSAMSSTSCTQTSRPRPPEPYVRIAAGVTRGAFKLNRVAGGLRHASNDPVTGQRIVQTVLAAADTLIPAGRRSRGIRWRIGRRPAGRAVLLPR
jgi:hypothetical protein